ncbi:peptide chain release factor PrfB3, chloroplastic isoform X2 [Corylus avellana]|uniref:peptide chain release factor PrfB3, chloroplastic isoform X2 n=1 Tax=Corylus avellana TaxID=13451 RepID=UPI00286B011C|nr:peptide chain release factor PrfB3, chloroplastic isoform X2 [Corylus avellana]
MATVAAEFLFVREAIASSSSSRKSNSQTRFLLHSTVRASYPMDGNDKAYEQLGLFSLKKKIEDAVIRAEMLAPSALELEEARRIKQEEMIHESNLWDDPAKSDKILVKFADIAKVVDALKDLTYKIWAEKLLSMYSKWAKKQGCIGRVVEKYPSKSGGIKSATIEFEFECAYGYLLGEKGVHYMIGSQNGSVLHEAFAACVDVVPLFLKTACNLQIDDGDLIVSPPLIQQSGTKPTICIQHIPTGIQVQSSGERNHFANKIKALNRLKAKLVVIASEQGVSSVSDIKRDAIVDLWQKETRRYVSHPFKLVEDVKTGILLPNLNSILDGNIEPLIEAHINIR